MRIGWDAPFPPLPLPEVLTGRKSRATGSFPVYTQLFHKYPHPVFSEITLYMGVCLLGTYKQMSDVHSFSSLAELSYIYPSVNLSIIPVYSYIYRSSILLHYQSIYLSFIISLSIQTLIIYLYLSCIIITLLSIMYLSINLSSSNHLFIQSISIVSSVYYVLCWQSKIFHE